jgi:hypothetical protein
MAVINQPNFFPASNQFRRYLPNILISGSTILSSTVNIIWFFPIFIKKYAENPTFCIEVTSYTVTAGTPIASVGIYQGVDIFSSGALLFSTDFSLTSLGVKKNSSILKLRPGWYTMASLLKVGPTSGGIGFRTGLQNLSMPIFGTRPGATLFTTLYGTYGINSSSFPTNLSGQSIVRLGGAGILPALEY